MVIWGVKPKKDKDVVGSENTPKITKIMKYGHREITIKTMK